MVKRFRERLSWWIRVITRVPNPTECTTPTANRNVNPGPWAIARRRCRFVSRDKRPTLRGMSIMEEAVCAWGAAGVGKSSAPPSRFCCAPKIPLLKNLFKMTIKREVRERCLDAWWLEEKKRKTQGDRHRCILQQNKTKRNILPHAGPRI